MRRPTQPIKPKSIATHSLSTQPHTQSTNNKPHPKSDAISNSAPHIDIEVQNNHVVVDITGTNPPLKKVNIFDAVKDKDFDTISLYVKAGGNVNVKNRDGYTPLMLAVQFGWNSSEVKKMLDRMPGIDLKLFAFQEYSADSKYGKPIDMAIKKNDVSLVKTLVDYAGVISINKEVTDIVSCVQKNYDLFKYLLSHTDEKSFNIGFTRSAINHLMTYKHTDSLDLINSILFKTKIIPDNMQQTILMDAAYYHKDYDVVNVLLMNNYIEKNNITNVMRQLVTYNDDKGFTAILENISNKQSIIDMFVKNFSNSTLAWYDKFAITLGLKEEPGTIYLSDVIHSANNSNLNFNDNKIHVDVKACQNGACVQVQVDLQPVASQTISIIPHVIEGNVV